MTYTERRSITAYEFWKAVSTPAPPRPPSYLGAAALALFLAVLGCMGPGCGAPEPLPGPVICDAAVRCGIYGSDPAEQERVRALCEASWAADNAPPRGGISSPECIAVILQDYTSICPFLEDPRATLPPECVPKPADAVCDAAEWCGALKIIGMTRDRCVETFSPAPLVAGIGTARCAQAVAADYQILCPFLTTGDATTIPEECVTT